MLDKAICDRGVIDLIPEGEQTGKCNRCGRCCYYKVITDIGPAFIQRCCPYYDKGSKRCRVFKRRFDVGIGCLCTEEAIRQRALPSDCPYVQGIEGYQGPVSWEELEILLRKKI